MLMILPAAGALASTGGTAKGTVPHEKAPETATTESSDFKVTGYASIDLVSGYVYRGSVMNDEPCYWTYGELNAGYKDLFSLGTWFFQNTDMTCCRKEMFRRMNEWDFGLDARVYFELTEDWKIGCEFGHCWSFICGATDSSLGPYEDGVNVLYGIVWLENPYVTPYFTSEYEYSTEHVGAMSGGMRHTFDLPWGFTLTPDASLGGGTAGYNAMFYPPFDGSVDTGITYVRAGAELAYWFNAHFAIRVTLDYSVLLDDTIRKGCETYGRPYKRDFLCGSIGVCVAF